MVERGGRVKGISEHVLRRRLGWEVGKVRGSGRRDAIPIRIAMRKGDREDRKRTGGKWQLCHEKEQHNCQ